MHKKGLWKSGVCLMAAMAAVTGFAVTADATWVVNEKGAWQYSVGEGFATGWQLINNKWYFFTPEGVMLTGVMNINGSVYYLGEQNDGAMKTGDIEINGLQFHFNEDGQAVGDLIPCTNIEYTTGSYSGWKFTNGRWQYINPQGFKATGWVMVNGKWYFLDENGNMLYGVVSIDGKVYYLGTPETGAMETGEVVIGGKTYFFADSGEAIGTDKPKPSVEYTTTKEGKVTNKTEEDAKRRYEEDDDDDEDNDVTPTPSPTPSTTPKPSTTYGEE